jgi:thioredoxin reductase
MHERRPGLARVVYAPHDVGPPGLSRVAAAPGLVRRLPVRLRRRITARCVRPAAAAWLTERLDGVDVVTGRPVAALARDGTAEVRLADGRVLRADHVLLGTGFRADVHRADALAPELAGAVRTAAGGSPVLGRGLETSVPGLHVAGALAAYSYGPVMRFVSGTWYAAPAVAAAVGDGR